MPAVSRGSRILEDLRENRLQVLEHEGVHTHHPPAFTPTLFDDLLDRAGDITNCLTSPLSPPIEPPPPSTFQIRSLPRRPQKPVQTQSGGTHTASPERVLSLCSTDVERERIPPPVTLLFHSLQSASVVKLPTSLVSPAPHISFAAANAHHEGFRKGQPAVSVDHPNQVNGPAIAST